MFRTIALMGLCISGTFALSAVAAPDSGPLGWGRACPMADTPVGRLVSGSIGRLLVLRSDLAITSEQKAEIREILVKHRAEIRNTAADIHQKRVVLRNTVLNKNADEAAIRAAADALGDSISDAAVKSAKLRAQIAPVLTEQQQQRVGEFLAEQDAAVATFFQSDVMSR